MTKNVQEKINELIKSYKSTKEIIRKLEDGVQGCIRNPSMSDDEPGRISISDVFYTKGPDAANTYREALVLRETIIHKVLCMKDREAKKLFWKEI